MSTQSKAQDGANAASQPSHRTHPRSHELLTCTMKSPPFSYVHLEIARDDLKAPHADELQFRAYCTSALKQFLGSTGEAIAIDILKVQSHECWLRVPRQDLGAFSAALTAWQGVRDSQGVQSLLRIQQCSDWLGCMVGKAGQENVWNT